MQFRFFLCVSISLSCVLSVLSIVFVERYQCQWKKYVWVFRSIIRLLYCTISWCKTSRSWSVATKIWRVHHSNHRKSGTIAVLDAHLWCHDLRFTGTPKDILRGPARGRNNQGEGKMRQFTVEDIIHIVGDITSITVCYFYMTVATARVGCVEPKQKGEG